MLARDLAELAKPDFVVFNDFLAVCGYHHKTTIMLSKFLWWARVTEEQHPEKNGWFFQTGKRMLQELGITRRGYEKAREILVGLGILDYKRAGVFAKMHWRVNTGKLYEVMHQIRGVSAPEFVSNVHSDQDGYPVPRFISLELWHDWLAMYAAKLGIKPSIKAKRRAIQQLEALQKAGEDVAYRLAYNTQKQWTVFKPFTPRTDYSTTTAATGKTTTDTRTTDDVMREQVAERHRAEEAIANARGSPGLTTLREQALKSAKITK